MFRILPQSVKLKIMVQVQTDKVWQQTVLLRTNMVFVDSHLIYAGFSIERISEYPIHKAVKIEFVWQI